MSEKTPVKIEIIKIIYEALLPAYYRLNSLLEDVTSGTYQVSDFDKSVLLDHASCATALKVLFEEYFNQTEESKTDTLYLDSNEYVSILGMAKTVETSHRTLFNSVGIWEH